MNALLLTLELQSEWHIGSGSEAGAYADALVLKDSTQLPYLPGKALKGLLKEAYQLAVDHHWFNDDLTALLFGQEGQEWLAQGLLWVSSACLTEPEMAYLRAHPEMKQHLYRVHSYTAMDSTTGVVKHGSLRSMEVTVPMQLHAQLTLDHSHPNYTPELAQTLFAQLEQVLPLIDKLGAKRHRGLGQVEISVKPQAQ